MQIEPATYESPREAKHRGIGVRVVGNLKGNHLEGEAQGRPSYRKLVMGRSDGGRFSKFEEEEKEREPDNGLDNRELNNHVDTQRTIHGLKERHPYNKGAGKSGEGKGSDRPSITTLGTPLDP